MARVLQVFRPRTGGTFAHVKVLAAELAGRGHEVAVCGPPGDHSDGGEDFEVTFFAAGIPRSNDLVGSARSIREVGSAYRTFRPDLIHAHGAQAGVIARLARAASPSVPLIHTPHRYAFVDGLAMTAGSMAYLGIERALMPLATLVLCVCEDERRIAERIGAGDRARVVHSGIDQPRSAPIPPGLAEAAGGPLLVAVAELFARKGVDVLIKAMAMVRERHPEARLIVAGDGPERGAIEQLLKREGASGYVDLAGHVDGVAGLLSAADVYVNPALAEAFPYGVLEAMSLGKPCVVTDVGGVREAVIDCESGLVVAAGDPGVLALAVSALLDDPQRARRLGERAAARVRDRFSRKQMIDGTLAVYAEIGIR